MVSRRETAVHVFRRLFRPLVGASNTVQAVQTVVSLLIVGGATGLGEAITRLSSWAVPGGTGAVVGALSGLAVLTLLALYSAERDLDLKTAIPRLTAKPMALREPGYERVAQALLEVACESEEQIRNAYAKVVRVVEHSSDRIDGESHPSSREIYEHQDVHLKWQAAEGRTHSFHGSAILEVARGRTGDGGYGLVTVGPPPQPRLHAPGEYEVTVQISSDNAKTLRRTFILSMATPTSVLPDGTVQVHTSLPPEVKFSEADGGD